MDQVLSIKRQEEEHKSTVPFLQRLETGSTQSVSTLTLHGVVQKVITAYYTLEV